MQRLKTRAQFEAAMAGGTVSRTPHFVLHRAALGVPAADGDSVGCAAAGRAPSPPAPDAKRPRPLFPIQDEAWLGAVVPKRWARRAVTRNGIKRQIYNVSAAFEARLPAAAHVVRLRMEFARKDFPSAWSEPLKAAVRAELQQLFEKATRSVVPAQATRSVIPAQAGTQGETPVIPAKAGIQEPR